MDDMDFLPESVSSGDAPAASSSVSSGDVYYQIEVYTVSGSDDDPQYTLFDKPLDDYSVTEGLLLILVLLIAGKYVWLVIKEGFKWMSW